MNVKLKVVSAGVLFFMGAQTVLGQKIKKDTVTKTAAIEEVIVVGYGKKTKSVVTSAVSVVSGDELSKFTGSTVGTNALQGKVAGLDVSSLNGKPGSGSNITVRGPGNITASVGASNPLFVIDGVLLGNDQRAQTIFNAIPTSEHESMSVLKDAAAAAIYGSQGANGVIILTTKKGKKGKPVINFISRNGFSQKIKDINFTMMNSSEKIAYEQNLYNLGASGYYGWPDQQEINDNLALNHDWQKDILRASFIESYQVGVRGASEKVRYNLSMGYDSDNGIVENIHAFKRYSANIGFDADATDKLHIGTTLGVNFTKSQEIRDRNNVQNPFRAIYDYNPYEPVFNSDGSYNTTFQGFPILEALKNNPSWNEDVIFNGSVFADYQITNNLSFKTVFGGYFNNARSTAKTLKGSVLDQILGLNGSVTQSNSNRFRYNFSNTLNYVKSFNRHNFDITGLLEYAETTVDFISAQGRNFSSPGLSELSNAATPFQVSGFATKYKTYSYGSFLTYDFDKKYVVTASIRQDADSRFGKNNTFSEAFWSLSGAWNVSSENFLKDVDFISNLKLRASIGTRGYNNIGLNLNQILMSGGLAGTFPTLVPSGNYGNPNLRWEVTKSTNYGAEFSVLRNRVRTTVDYFIDQKKDFLLDVPNASTEGGSYSTTINSGKLTNKGLELSVSGDVLKSKNGINWSLRANTTFMSYKLNNLRDTEKERILGINILRESEEPFSFFLVRSAGVNSLNGNEQYLTKDGAITEIYSSNDAVLLEGKSPLPEAFGGFGTTFTYKGFDLAADFSFKYGNYTYNYMALNMLNHTNGNDSNLRTDASNYWTAPGQTNVLPRPNNASNAPGGIQGLQVSDRFLQDASYIRFRNLSLGYTFDRSAFNDLPVNKVRVSLTGQNLATWTKFEGDPEVSIGSGENQTGAGQTFINGAYALYSYPAVQSFLFGLEIEF